MNELIRDNITPFFDKLLRKIDNLEDRIEILNKKISHLDTLISNMSNISMTTIPNTTISTNEYTLGSLDKNIHSRNK
jgi:hypothetical protein